MAERLTNQKQFILDYLQDTTTHPTAEEIYLNVKRYLPRISLGTIYRNLENFVATGKILEINGATKRFDGDISDHQHFICNSCGKVYDIFCKMPKMKNFENHNHKKIGIIESYQISFYGKCNKCK
ncbi:MAG: Transcriptional regulator, Fur family [Candidatus Moranbacteria bacterium GW2011_GWE1_35_17]|nr:MAG: Transcriptional regulator, Fur family [Candidatus Moranbacteria bacterium GW2011_GWE1_35_17]KKP71842.1 MAG: Transcriptional regulator, Fur family [Candidatus Moranbacteria bacterium GW2011_GWE2_35_164]KKP83538.1 MAG: Transcriptional regulator, Fur family [Candidatus Moranbacteria bacterium GW2011_GWF1_35_5]